MSFFKRFFGRGERVNQSIPENLLSDTALKLILESEGLDQPSRHPGGESGITIGVGYDLGYVEPERFALNWQDRLSASDFNRLKGAIGVKGSRAAAMAHLYKGIIIKREDAMAVFREHTVPLFYKLTEKTFPGINKLAPDAKGALVSIVFNRGSKLTGPTRVEMARIKDILGKAPTPADKATYQAIAKEIRSMRRLWVGKGLDGLLTRREREAKLVESCIS